MIDRRLLDLVDNSRKYTLYLLLIKVTSLLCNILILKNILAILFKQKSVRTFLFLLVLKAVLLYLEQTFGSFYSQSVKSELRNKIFDHLFKVEGLYQKELSTSELVQVSLDGVSQLDAYYHLYIPQFFYSLLAPLILFFVLKQYHFKIALMLLVAVPLIPLSIIFVQKFAKKLLDKYWGQYTQLGNTFLDRLQGLSPLKTYGAQTRTLNELDQEAEDFRVVTMRVLMMQLNSISVMDLVAYGGSALAMIASIKAFQAQEISFAEMIFIVLLSADYFIPMRQLGSYFHLSMNGVAASDRLHRFLAIPGKEKKLIPKKYVSSLEIKDVTVSYPTRKDVACQLSMRVKKGEYHVIVGESGSGKSSLAKAILGLADYQGSILLDEYSLCDYQASPFLRAQLGRADLFNMSLYENMCLGIQHSRLDCEEVLKRLQLDHLSLDQMIQEGGQNLSGGEKQRIAFSRMLLNQSDFYLFDEVTSNVDVESEGIILEEMKRLVDQHHGVIFITHRLKNAESADCIHVFKKGRIVEQGDHEMLMQKNGEYARLYEKQSEVENIGKQ